MRRGQNVLAATCMIVTFSFLFTAPVTAYDRYSINDNSTNCRFCHGDFRAFTYVSQTDGQTWSRLHDIHRNDMLDGDCDVCHLAGDEFPVMIGDSAGGDGLAPFGCVGCHGRAEDGTGAGTEGFGLAMQRRHEAAAVGGDQNGDTCFSCHLRAVDILPVGENILPPYYANPGNNHTSMPTDPCNPNAGEDFAGAAVGIDNDGDFDDDQNDTDCGAVSPSPGEASGQLMIPMRVTNQTSDSLTISYDVPCEAANHRIHFGALDQVSSYSYAGTQCDLQSSGLYTWTLPVVPESLFFIVVADNGIAEGSYGVASTGTERPSNMAGSACALPKDLVNRCD